MSKRESSTTLERPIEPIPAPCRKKVTHTRDALKQPVEPERTAAVIPFDLFPPEVLDYAPIAHYLRTWCDGRYSRQCLRRMLTTTIDAESWHALKGVREWRYVHASNCKLIEVLLAALDGEREVERAA